MYGKLKNQLAKELFNIKSEGLYKTERTIDIPAGEYEIVVGGAYEGGFGQLKTTIKI